jgi:NAD+ kinase
MNNKCLNCTFQVVTRYDEESKEIGKFFETELLKHQWVISETPSIVITVGGDGTMLEAFQKYYGNKTAFVGIHTGTLGFYTDWQVSEKEELLKCLLENKPTIVDYPLAEIDVYHHNKKRSDKFVVLNDFVIKSPVYTFNMDIYINNKLFEHFKGDGMIISTPSGSTAYNYSVRGAIIHPSLEALQVAELASLNNIKFRTLNSSFILPKHHELDLYVKNRDEEVVVVVDGKQIPYSNVSHMSCKVSKKKINFLRYRPLPFWQRVKDKFLGNEEV